MPQEAQHEILSKFHSSPYGGHFGSQKVLQSGFLWPSLFKDSHRYVQGCDKCQRVGSMSNRNEMLLRNIHEVESLMYGIHPPCSRLCVKMGTDKFYIEK